MCFTMSICFQTLELLFLMANESNIEVICQKFLECLPTLSDTTNQQQLSDRVIQMAQKYPLKSQSKTSGVYRHYDVGEQLAVPTM